MVVRGFTGNTVILFGGGGGSSPFPPAPVPAGIDDQPSPERSGGFPQVFAFRVEFEGNLTEEMGELVDELLQ